jgi:deazaflavin-dependent oxidoreductase (nitroreductase family)
VKDIKAINRRVIEQFRAGGPVDDFDRDNLILLTTVGSRSGQRRTSPMAFYEDGNRQLVVANNQGGAKHPNWYVNLIADQRVTVEVGGQSYSAVAVELQGEEREQVWNRLRIVNPYLTECQARISRTLPIIALTRV